jgi:hypothetical protein
MGIAEAKTNYGSGTAGTLAPGVDGSGQGNSDFVTGERYRQQLAAAQAAQMGVAQQIYQGAGEAGRLAGVQMRSAAVPSMIAEAGAGNALASRAAVMGAGQAGYGAGLEATRLSSGDRLAAGDVVMGAQAQVAAYEQAQMEAYLQRLKAEQDMMAQIRAADVADELGEDAALAQITGSTLSAGAAGAASMVDAYGTGGK